MRTSAPWFKHQRQWLHQSTTLSSLNGPRNGEHEAKTAIPSFHNQWTRFPGNPVRHSHFSSLLLKVYAPIRKAISARAFSYLQPSSSIIVYHCLSTLAIWMQVMDVGRTLAPFSFAPCAAFEWSPSLLLFSWNFPSRGILITKIKDIKGIMLKSHHSIILQSSDTQLIIVYHIPQWVHTWTPSEPCNIGSHACSAMSRTWAWRWKQQAKIWLAMGDKMDYRLVNMQKK